MAGLSAAPACGRAAPSWAKPLNHSAATSTVPTPPSTTEPTGPNQAAVAPDSNSPSWLLAPMKTEFTALTRPRIAWRLQLHQGLAHHHADHVGRARHRQRGQRQPQLGGQAEHHGGQAEHRHRPSSLRPTWRSSGQRVSHSDISKAPAAGAARSRPRPQGPTCSTSLA
jgi:hypothetical protein